MLSTDAIAEAFSEAAVDSSRWPAAMEVAAAATESFGAILVPLHAPLPSVPYSTAMAASFERWIDEGWIERDERYRGVPTIVRKGIATEADFISADEISRNPYYQEFLAPCGLRWWAGVKVAAGDDFWCLSLQRSFAQGRYSEAEQQLLAHLSTVLGSPAALARALSFARAESAMSAFVSTGTAIVLLDIRGEVLQANPSAERLFGADLQIAHRRIVSFDHAATDVLDRALHGLLWTCSASASLPPVLLPRRNGRPVLAYPVRLAGVTGEPLGYCQAILVFVDLDQRHRPPEATLRSSFGLTAAEARIANLIASGTSLNEAADRLRVSKETVRSELKAVFAKTHTSRQAELIALLARLGTVAAANYTEGSRPQT